MDKIDEARELLKMLGMPKAQQADICCYVLLAMAGIKQDTLWKDAGNEWIRIHDIIQFANTYYGSTYLFAGGLIGKTSYRMGLPLLLMARLMRKTAGKLFVSRHCTIFGTLRL